MKKTNPFKSSLVILLMCFGLASLWGQETIAGWTFPTNSGAAPLTINADCGAGTIYANGTNGSSTWTSNTTNYQFFGGNIASTENQVCGTSETTGALSPTGNQNNEKHIVFRISTSGFEDLKLTYDTRGTNTGFTTHTWAYSSDGVNFANAGTITGRNSTSFSNQTVDFSNISATDNQTDLYIRLTFSGATNSSGNNRIDNIKFIGTPAEISEDPCDPDGLTAGTTVANSTEIQSGGSVNLSLDGASTGTGLTYQWQSSANGDDWTDIEGATNATYTATNITAATWFRALVTCSETTTVESTPVLVNLAYCTPLYTIGCSSSDRITNFVLEDISNNTGSSCNSSPKGYSDYTGQSTDLTQGETYIGSISIGNGGAAGVAIWIDFNNDRTFSTSERVFYTATNLASGSNNNAISVIIPSDATPGEHRMRVRHVYTSGTNIGASIDPCNEYNYGETEDYTVNIIASSPTLIANPADELAFTAVAGGADTEDITVTGVLLTDDITVALSGANADQFSLSTTSFDSEGGTLTVTYEPETVGTHTATITLSSTGADDVVLELNGTATLGTPTAMAATDITSGGFTANWQPLAGAESYEVDVYEMSGSVTPDVTVVGWDFDDENETADEGVVANSSKIITKTGGGTTSYVAGYNGAGIGGQAISSGGNNAWTDGANSKYWEISFETTGFMNMTLSSAQFSSGTGPRDFKVQYKIGAEGTYTDVPDSSIVLGGSGTDWTGVLTGVPLPVACDNQPVVYLRWIMTSNTQFSGSGNVGSGGTSRIDNIKIVGDQGGSTNVYTLQNENVGNVTSYEVIGLDPETTYYYVVRAVAGEGTSANSNEIAVTTAEIPSAITWLADNSGWSNEDGPGIDDDAVIEGDLTISGALEAKNLAVSENGSVTIANGGSLTLSGKITNEGDFTVQSGGNLIQTSAYEANDNAGDITVQRKSQDIVRLDYTFWSSPVNGQYLQDFSEETLWNRIYTYETNADNFDDRGAYEQVFATEGAYDSSLPFQNGKGYLFRAPNNWDIEYDNEPTPYLGTFTGTPFNGDTNVNVYGGDGTSGGFTSIGNPYPSNIRAIGENSLYSNNSSVVDVLYFWNNPEREFNETTETWEYVGTKYVTCSTGGCTKPGGDFISVGQGFIVRTLPNAPENSQVTFTNSMRVNNATTFLKTEEAEMHRFWLSLSNADGNELNQILTGYMTDATNDIDQQIDGELFGYEGSAIYNVIGDASTGSATKFVIQGRALPFETSDVVPLGFRAAEDGKFVISLTAMDGLFAEGQTVYLKDKQLGIIHNLSESAYDFESPAGEFDTRFEIVYEDEGTMATGDLAANAVQIYTDNKDIVISSKAENILSVELYGLQGRKLHRNDRVNAHIYRIKSASFGTQVLVVRVQTQNGEIVSKKVINK